MKPSYAAVRLAKDSEGLRLVAYPDPGTGGAPWTIGYGSTVGVLKDDTISLDQAEARLDRDLANAAAIVNQAVKVPLTQGQFDALTDFVFNIGPGRKGVKDGFVVLKSGQPSTILRKLNASDYAGAAAEFPKWTKAAGRELPGLVTRRAKERAMFEGRAA
ncbi:MAG: lysozyme [Luteibacter sp.]|uniref:lysozyme n=1 Tax=Luteibacter sp. TaxID=1886636 RepID=UPI00280A35FC|nr:lysozyme [Luteibacter sp.]MDQ7996054.1 lysozyme [Luteibacter sp.]